MRLDMQQCTKNSTAQGYGRMCEFLPEVLDEDTAITRCQAILPK